MNKTEKTILRKLTQIGFQAYKMGFDLYPKKLDEKTIKEKLIQKYSKKFKKSSVDNLIIIIKECYRNGYETKEQGLSYNNLYMKQKIKKSIKEQIINEPRKE